VRKENQLLGGQEILFYAMNEASPKHFLIAAEVEGLTAKTNWQNAVEALQKAHPMLSRSIIAAGDNLLFEVSKDTALLLEIEELIAPLNLNAAIEAALEKGFQSNNGPLARIKLLYSEQKSIIILAVHHSIGDALSTVDLLNDLLGNLSGKDIQQLPLQPSLDELLGFDNEGLAVKINKQIKVGIPLPHAFLKEHPPARIDIVHLSKDVTTKLAYAAKRQSTTVHGALQAAAALSLNELAFEINRPAYIMSPFSVRNDVNIGTDCRLFIDTKIVPVSTDANLDFWEIARLANEGLADVHTPEFLKSSAEQLRGLISSSDDLIQFIKDHFNFDIMLSNLGRLSISNADVHLQVNYVAGPFIISGLNNQQAIGAATYNQQLTLTNSSRYLVSGLLEMMQNRIIEAIK
jgi:hypothetical protein